MKGSGMKVTVAMITMNEEGAIAKVIADIRRAVPEAGILIVDSSKDKTPEIAASLGVEVVRQFPPQGYGRAMDRALRSAQGDVVVTLDCDDTYPTEAIPEMLRWIEQGYDLVNASRLNRRPKAMPMANYAANLVFAGATYAVHGLKTMDVHSGMRAYRKTMLDQLQWNPDGPALPVELLILPYRKGFRVKDIGIDYRERVGQTTLNRWQSTVWTFKRILGLRGVKPDKV